MKQRPLPVSVCLAVCLIALLAACGMGKEHVEGRVAAEFQHRLDTDDDTSDYGMKVRSVTLIKSGRNAYDGYVTVVLDGETHDVGISVITDSSDIMLQTDPFAFSFLTEKALEQLFNMEESFDWAW